jgi:hypothetical protein
MLSKIYCLLVLFCFLNGNFFSQNTKTKKWRKTENDSMQSALLMIDDGNYLQALPFYENLYSQHPKEEYLKYCYGICALTRSDKHDVALKMLSEVYEKNKKVDNIEYDLARANHYNYKFDEAIVLIEKSLVNKRVSPETKKKAIQLKQYCINGKDLFAKPTGAKIENIGNVINSPYEEYVPIISADESIMLFTYRGIESTGGLQNEFLQPDRFGKYYEDIFQADRIDGEWKKPMPVKSANTNSHDGAIAISPDGFYLFVYRDNGDDHGDIYMSNSLSGEWTEPKKLNGQVNSYSWEGSCSLTADGKYLYFSSERGGGYGGKDIYRATLLPDSTWGNVINLGDSINTALDDDAPFIHPDGVTLFYSSQGKNSMGGFDIFQSRLNWKDSTFSNPVNLGYPINTTDDDIYYVLSANGDRGYYASGKAGGQGLKDIYSVYPGFVGKKPSLFMVKGKITEKGSSVGALISVEIVDQNNNKFADFTSNASTGNYLVSLPAGAVFKLTYKYKNYTSKTLDINTLNLEGYDEKIFDVNFDSLQPVFAAVEPKKDTVIAVEELLKVIEPVEVVETIKEAPIAKKFVLKPNTTLQEKIKYYSELYGDISEEGLQFRVQIAAYKYPKNYRYHHLKGLGDVENLLLDDGITRITIGGNFSNLGKAFEHNVKVIKAGQTDAFVTVIYNGKRIYLEDLEKMGIFVKK